MAEPWRFRVSRATAALVRGLHPGLKAKVRAECDIIRDDPSAGKGLRDDLVGLRGLRVGRVRIVYAIRDERVIEIVAVGPRRTIYEETARLVRRDRGGRR